MKDMIVPTAADLIGTVRRTLKTIVPSLTELGDRSAAATMEHVLRYAEQRVEHEGQILLDEALYLKRALPGTITWLEGRGDTALAAQIVEAVSAGHSPETYVSLRMMAEDVGLLRRLVRDLLTKLHERDVSVGDPEGDKVHAAMLAYLSWQIDKEAELIEPAFRGHGPRR
jgi:hypothetical protein